MGPLDREALAGLLVGFALLATVLVATDKPCDWEPERGFEVEYREFSMMCLFDRQHAADPAELCQYKAANRGLVRWVCRK